MFKPQCMPFDVVDGQPIRKDKEKPKGLAYVQEDFLMPCVWCNQKKYRDELHRLYGLMDPELKLSNHTGIWSVLKTPQWKKFVDALAHEKDLLPVCIKRCKHDV
jgi:hypothetical protein|tara:strand:+ start:412 stop:723 length:312 start_codon:yes stop_codon:yes gene_type:complete